MSSNVTKLKDEQYAADTARQLLKNPQLAEAFDAIEESYLKALLITSEKDDLARFRFTEAIKVARTVRRHLELQVENGKLAAKQLDEMSGKSKIRSFF